MTLTLSTNPSVSTRRWRFLPRTFFPPSYPRASPPTPVVLADCESTTPALGCRFLLSRTRKRSRRAALSRSKVPTFAPPPKPPVDSLPGREVAGSKPPSAAALEEVEDGVEDLAGAVGFRSSSLVGRRNMELQTLPFSIGEIGGVAPFHAQERTSSTYPPRFSKQFQKGNSRKPGFRYKLFSEIEQT